MRAQATRFIFTAEPAEIAEGVRVIDGALKTKIPQLRSG
jgi:hypothetical protein